jgi:hypothetical protein
MIVLFLLFIPVWCAAQGTEVLQGTVRDAQSGEPVARVRVSLIERRDKPAWSREWKSPTGKE